MKKPKVIQRGKLTYYLYEEKVVVRIGEQYVSYNIYDNWNRQGITQFINIIKKSKEHEYGNAMDQISLAMQCGIRGSATAAPKDVE